MPYDAPGIYIEPLPTGPAPIRSVATAVLGVHCVHRSQDHSARRRARARRVARRISPG